MKATLYEHKQRDSIYKLSIYCPYCRQNAFSSALEIVQEENFHRIYGVLIEDNDAHKWGILVCNACGKPLLHKINFGDTYPTALPDPVDHRIPLPMFNALSEAKACFSVNAFQASATMSRLAIQRACRDRGAAENPLHKQIKELFESQKITRDIMDWAESVRFIGNDGAHEQNDAVDRQDAESALYLAESFLTMLYIPSTIAREQREKRALKSG
jgi:uncharacterized protein YbaR (Trm112 family)